MKLFKTERMHKKGYGVMDLMYFGVIFIALTIVLSFGSTILADLRDDQTVNAGDYNTTTKGMDSIYKFAKWTPTLANVLVAAVIVSILMGAFMFAVKRDEG